MLWASARSREAIPRAKREILLAIRESQHLPPDVPESVSLEDLGEVAASVDKVLVGFSLFLGAIGAVSLLVGGIGIMNIMLVSVTERTREIGLRMALGATDFAILTQFLIEASVLSFLGGLLGIGLGQLLTLGIANIPKAELDMAYVPWQAVALAFVFSGSVGIFFGMFPAIKAARLDPIEALRHE
jgi:putative ABC transport system permease protein